MAKIALFVAFMALYASGVYGAATMTVQSGKVLNLDEIASQAKGKCCLGVKEIGLGVVDGDQTIVRMDGSNGRFYVTNDPNCGNFITSSAYATSFSYLYVCGQCKGGCPQVDGGKTLVPAGGSCGSGSYDISKKCISSAPVCMTPQYKCVTIAEASAPPAPTPAPAAACTSYSNLGQDCNNSGKCCGGGPKNAKCENGKCVTTYPTGRKAL